MRHTATLLAWACLFALAVDPLPSGAAQTSTSRAGGSQSAAPQSATAQTAGEPATWITRDVEVKLQNLPKTYSCDGLWYKLRGILLAIGARQYMSITPYDCGRGAAHGGRSPTVDLKFQTLRVLTGANIRWAETTAESKIVRLGPGEPKILDSGDCALLAQFQGTVFEYLGMHVVATNLECSTPHGATHFSLLVRALAEEPSRSSGT